MVACHSDPFSAFDDDDDDDDSEDAGGANSSKRVEPHSFTAQAGASRSGAWGERARREARLWERSRLGCESWYLSGKRVEGRVR